VASLVKTESQLEPVLAFKTSEVTVIELSKDKNNRASLGKGERKVRVVIVQSPRDRQCSPQLADSPIGCEKAGSLKGLILLKKVFVRDPEISIVSEAMIELLKPLGRPLLGAVA
jgi:tRNA uridine 5-carbamoylmethylation protein Kti12